MPFTNTDDTIDSRDIIARIEELEEAAMGQVEPEGGEEYAMLVAFAKEASDYAEDWQYGATLVHESYFEKYCEEMVKDCGDLPQDIPWYIVIDWEATANNMRQDYTEVELDGETYLIR